MDFTSCHLVSYSLPASLSYRSAQALERSLESDTKASTVSSRGVGKNLDVQGIVRLPHEIHPQPYIDRASVRYSDTHFIPTKRRLPGKHVGPN